MKKKILIGIISISGLSIASSCADFVEIDPPRTDLVKSTVFASDETATAAIMAIYGQMSSFGSIADGYTESITFIASLSSDEILNYNSDLEFSQFNNNSILASNSRVAKLWSEAYQYIFKANAVIEGLAKSSGVSDNLKKQLEGEAKFIRAFNHFYLVNLFGDVPLVLTTDYRINSTIPRAPTTEVYKQIVQDLLDAQNLLSDDYPYADERVRPNRGTATALLARVYLYTNEFELAEIEASSLIDNSTLYSLVGLNDVFLANSKEAIWQLGNTDGLAVDIGSFNFPFFRNSALRPSFINSFEVDDQRMFNWIESTMEGSDIYYYSSKYKSFILGVTEYSMIFRLAEQYLIRAESRAQQDNISEAREDLNIIRNRAGLDDTPANDKPSMLTAVEQERKVELFTEWGHRWLDLKRSGNIGAVLGTLKPNWDANAALYPIPQIQIQNDPAMKNAQNPGY